ncbi:MAG TPA: hypothetical protein VJ770_25510 [Stellaceae bacterium]|nr:hypothetical protein [Stellaceae bacterium]
MSAGRAQGSRFRAGSRPDPATSERVGSPTGYSDTPGRRFLDGGFAKKAAALGWGPFDLFGCDRDRPFVRIDQAGLLWALNGDRLIALSENAAARPAEKPLLAIAQLLLLSRGAGAVDRREAALELFSSKV